MMYKYKKINNLIVNCVKNFSRQKIDTSKNWYQVLGVSNNSTLDQIKKAYYEKAKKYHPDGKNGNTDQFKEINQAYSILGNQEQRKLYDMVSNQNSYNNFKGNQQSSQNQDWSKKYHNMTDEQKKQFQQRQEDLRKIYEQQQEFNKEMEQEDRPIDDKLARKKFIYFSLIFCFSFYIMVWVPMSLHETGTYTPQYRDHPQFRDKQRMDISEYNKRNF